MIGTVNKIEASLLSGFGKVLIKRFVFAWNKTFFITQDKYCPFKGSNLVLIIKGFIVNKEITIKWFIVNKEITTHRSLVIGDIVCDKDGDRIEIIEIINP